MVDAVAGCTEAMNFILSIHFERKILSSNIEVAGE